MVSMSVRFPSPRPSIRPTTRFLPSCLLTGPNAAVLATKSCSSEGTQAVTFVQHSPPPGIMVVSYSSYCEDSLCNNRVNLPDLWNPSMLPGTLGGERETL